MVRIVMMTFILVQLILSTLTYYRFLEHADPLLKVTIIPRTSGALGYAQYLPKEVFLRTQEQIMDYVCMALAGRAAEEIFFGSVTTGASNDLDKVTQLVYGLIQNYGMNSRVGQLSFESDGSNAPWEKPYSEATAQAMDEEARMIVDKAYERTLDLLKSKKEELEKVSALLLEKEVIDHNDMIDILGNRPFKGDKAYEEFVNTQLEKSSGGDEKEEDEGKKLDGTIPGLA